MREIKVIDSKNMIVGESPLWDEKNGLLYTVDFRGQCIRTINMVTLESTEVKYEREVSCLALCSDGKLLVAMENGVYYEMSDGELAPLWVPKKMKGRRLNDGKVGPDGKFYVGSKDENHEGALYCCDSKGNCVEVLNHVGSSNGSAWSSDGRKFYYCDTMDMELCSYDFDIQNGKLSNRQSIMKLPEGIGEYDGMAIDAEDKLWCAVWDSASVYRIDPEQGIVMEKIRFPVSKISSCTFVGEDLKTLVVTTASIRTDMEKEPLAGCTFAVRVDVPGRIFNRFEVHHDT